VEAQLAQLQSSGAQAPLDADLDQLLRTSHARLESADLDGRAAILDLLNVQVTPTDDGYQLEASIPLEHSTTTTGESGYIASLEPQHP
jgi:hypothetical protein